MIKSEIIKKVANLMPLLSIRDIDLCIDRVIEKVTETLDQGGRVEIRGFGVFLIRLYAKRNSRNPKTGEKVVVRSKSLPRFKPGKELRDRVNANRHLPIKTVTESA